MEDYPIQKNYQEISANCVDSLINIMIKAPVFSKQQLESLWDRDKENRKDIFFRMLETGESYGQASGVEKFLTLPEEAFFKFLRSIDNELEQNVEIVKNSFKKYLKNGEAPAPYYAWRIAIILRKMKQKDKERDFLSAWCLHFGHINYPGSRYAKLVERAEKMGVLIQ